MGEAAVFSPRIMALKGPLAVLLAFAASAYAQSQVWGQCGGIGWTGATTCVSGSTCTYSNDWYSQCLPGGPASTAAPTSTTVLTTSQASTTSVATTGGSPTTTAAGGGSSACPTLPASITLQSNAFLPDPFTFINGQKVVTKDDWACRREEISQLFQRYELGTLPPKPSSVTASLSGTSLTINVSEAGKSISFSVSISRPSSGTAPFPAIIAYGGLSIPTPAGVSVITFNNDDIAAQNDGSSRGQGKFFTLYGSSHSAGAMTAWAWGVSRIIDALELTPSANIDLTKIGVSGCSRNGKGALVAGAFDARIALTIPQESGSGGAGSWRISDGMMKNGTSTQTASEIVGENVWFSTLFNPYVNQVNMLPFDHHMLSALVAPRALLIIDNTGIDWLGPESVFGAQKTANKVWQALGIADKMGVSQVGNHNHCQFPSSEQPDLDAFVNKFLKGQSTNTNIIKTDGANNAGFVESQWVNWQVPTLIDAPAATSAATSTTSAAASTTSVASTTSAATSTSVASTTSAATSTIVASSTTVTSATATASSSANGLNGKFVAKGKRFWGSCADSNTLNIAANAAILQSDFGQVTPENSMKVSSMLRGYNSSILILR
ncbi:hypothetical protein BDZ89DRAFT_217024 [Hymenopellis radicata]|nr:hypothetical protein BDZ89DRAFT_217024 [Hymenopellis radicata]